MEYTEHRLLELAEKICKMLNWYWSATFKVSFDKWLFYLRVDNCWPTVTTSKYSYAVNLVSDLVDKLFILKLNENDGKRI